MKLLPGSQYYVQFGLRGWAALALGLATFIAIAAVFAIGFLFVALPLIVLAPVIYLFAPKNSKNVLRTSGPVRTKKDVSGGRIVEGEYRVIDSSTHKGRSASPSE